MKIEMIEADAQKLINSQRKEIDKLKEKLKVVAKNIEAMSKTKAKLPEAFLKAATDLCGFNGFGESVNEDWLEEMGIMYREMLAKKPYDREKLPVFSEAFLFAILNDDPVYASNIRYEIREIMEASGCTVPEFMKRS